MVRILGLVDWVRANASEPNMRAIGRRFNLIGFRHDRVVVRTRHDDGPLGADFDERA
jgi:hypothetical protein